MSYPPPDEDFEPGDVVAYVCGECGHRHDVVVDDEPMTRE
jgi:predicted nucleic acid-binding Zn ribbon protein